MNSNKTYPIYNEEINVIGWGWQIDHDMYKIIVDRPIEYLNKDFFFWDETLPSGEYRFEVFETSLTCSDINGMKTTSFSQKIVISKLQ